MEAFPKNNKEFYLTRVRDYPSISLCAAAQIPHLSQPHFFSIELGLPYWFESVTDYLTCDNFANDLLEAIKTGVNVNKIRTSFLIFIQKQNIKNLSQRAERGSTSHLLVLTVFDLLITKRTCENLVQSGDMQTMAYKMRYNNALKMDEMLTRLTCGLIRDTIPLNQQNNIQSSIQALTYQTKCVTNSMELAEIDKPLARKRLIKLLKELKIEN